ncbi:ornithine cyclodeaminase [Actinokineospora bangkokensis]|uniref:Ornithine cyclodeaminase n=1 Tax=Actinokineospora bangkokensis TaxID=1193682 RepID=A0A1Q9LK45_9PSEU|nr:ornithine cyclodeaminase [Actinokineospora bangkokensis]OLR92359.1 ornithine cyclodeaminase [Actinokineospora bangkokensis]
MGGPITYLDSADVAGLCAGLPLVDLARDTLLAVRRGEAGLFPETGLRWTNPAGAAARSLILPAWAGTSYGCKIINASLGNQALGLPRAAGLIVLNDPETAQPVCVMEGARISALRTAAVSVAALRAARDLGAVTSVAFLGSGRQAEVHLELLAPLCPRLGEVVLHDVVRGQAEKLAEALSTTRPGVRVAEDARSAVSGADITIAVTTTTEPYVDLDWVAPGATFVNVSLDDATEGLLLGCDHLFVDDWDLVVDDDHRLLGKLARSGRVSAPGTAAPEGGRAVDADLPALFSGEYTRPITATDRVVVNPFGMGVHDVAIAAAVHATALERGIGLALPR